MKMNNLIFTAVLTACLEIRGHQPGPGTIGPFPEGLGQSYFEEPAQLNSSYGGSWPPLVSPHSTLHIAMYTSTYYILTYFAGSFCQYNTPAKVFCWSMTIHPSITALAGLKFANLLPQMLQETPEDLGCYMWRCWCDGNH
ncbi:hypothetical protein DSO57_1004881 [Entomophthora muscae]|uniref:Uncharacterized protein n=1 Tax=Entomophthora muscae TaxID=34485 RepID=A0ACC2TWN2_9FUNG|nr:hypothetical protein DSO57_1004881 [Entomophthora muscae]